MKTGLCFPVAHFTATEVAEYCGFIICLMLSLSLLLSFSEHLSGYTIINIYIKASFRQSSLFVLFF